LSTTTTTKRRVDSTKRASASPTRERLSKRQLRPLGDRVVVEPTPHDEMTKSGILIPDTVKEKPQKGTVLAVGPGRILDNGMRERIDVLQGDKVLYAKYAGTEFKIDDLDLLIVSQKDILAIVED
jgi:chaperonin GroES